MNGGVSRDGGGESRGRGSRGSGTPAVLVTAEEGLRLASVTPT